LGFSRITQADAALPARGARRVKLLIEVILAAAACIALAFVMPPPLANALAVPFFKNALFNLGWFFVPFGVLSSPARRIRSTDRRPRRAGDRPAMIAAASFAIISYLVGNAVYANTCSCITWRAPTS